MEKDRLQIALESLALTASKKNKTAVVALYINEIEKALSAGSRRKDVVDELNKFGFGFSISTFETCLKRIRARKLQSPSNSHLNEKSKPTVLKTDTESTAPLKTFPEPKTISHDPRDLDKIFSSQPDLEALAKFAPKRR
ncbi:MAG: hypothetical protein EOP06_07705 [Proteobacteria bacterium]|nr:MAG: hypothetical protein EOP06_07705 [Pseudomonadota bacterium]